MKSFSQIIDTILSIFSLSLSHNLSAFSFSSSSLSYFTHFFLSLSFTLFKTRVVHSWDYFLVDDGSTRYIFNKEKIGFQKGNNHLEITNLVCSPPCGLQGCTRLCNLRKSAITFSTELQLKRARYQREALSKTKIVFIRNWWEFINFSSFSFKTQKHVNNGYNSHNMQSKLAKFWC